MKDPYRLLDVARAATDDDIRKAYRQLARKHHPDANPDDPHAEERFKEIQQAYETLSDPKRRRAYDERYRPSPRRRAASPRVATGGGTRGKTTGIVDLARLAKLAGKDVRMKASASFENGGAAIPRNAASDGLGRKPRKPPVPPKPPKTRKPPDVP